MDQERNETYERIPWEMLEKKGQDTQWWLFVVAGAVVVGALAYSFMRNQPPPQTSTQAVIATTMQSPTVSQPPPVAPFDPVPTTVAASPVVVSEADLYAVDPERVLDAAVSHAEWFVAEYFTVDGSATTKKTLGALLPAGVPLPQPEPGRRVFVEFVRATAVEETEPFHYRITVLVRSLAATGDEPYVRQAPIEATVEVASDENGPQVLLPPVIQEVKSPESAPIQLTSVPDEVASEVMASTGASEVLGGVQTLDGGWRVVVMAAAADGVVRPQTIELP